MTRVDSETREHIKNALNELIGQQGVTKFAKSISQDDEEKTIQKRRSDVNNWLSGKSDIRLTELITISKKYNVSVDYILGLSKHPSPDHSIKSAIKTTGLNENAVKTLTDPREKGGSFPIHHFINALLESPYYRLIAFEFNKLIEELNLYKTSEERYTKLFESTSIDVEDKAFLHNPEYAKQADLDRMKFQEYMLYQALTKFITGITERGGEHG